MGISSHPQLFEKAQEMIPLFKCLGDEMRAEIMIILSDEGELNVSQITERVELSRPAVSHHLLLLKQLGLVTVRKDGNERFYRIKFLHALEEIEEWIFLFRSQCKNLE